MKPLKYIVYDPTSGNYLVDTAGLNKYAVWSSSDVRAKAFTLPEFLDEYFAWAFLGSCTLLPLGYSYADAVNNTPIENTATL